MKIELNVEDVACLKQSLTYSKRAIENSQINSPEPRSENLARIERVLEKLRFAAEQEN